MSLTFTNCIIWLDSRSVIFVTLTHGLINILSFRGIFPSLKCFLRNFSGIFSPMMAQKEDYLEPKRFERGQQGCLCTCQTHYVHHFTAF